MATSPDPDSQLPEHDYDPSYDDAMVHDASYDQDYIRDPSYDEIQPTAEQQIRSGSSSRRPQAAGLDIPQFEQALAATLRQTLEIYHHVEQVLAETARARQADPDHLQVLHSLAGSLGTSALGFVCSYRLFHSQWPQRQRPDAAIELLQIIGQNLVILAAVSSPETAAGAPFLPAEQLADLYGPEVRSWLAEQGGTVPEISFA